MPSFQKIVLALAFAATALSAQISDGQLQQATTPVAVVKQITDGQLQQATSTPAGVTPAVVQQNTHRQIQQVTTSPAPLVAPVKQITDGQIQQVASASKAPVPSSNGTAVTTPASPAATFHGAASIVSFSSELAAVAIGAVAIFAML